MNQSRQTLVSVALCVSLFMSVFTFAANQATAKTPPASPTAGLTEFAASKGVKTCLKRMGQVNDYVVKNNQAGAYVFIPPHDTNKKIVSTSLEMYSTTNPNSAPSYASTSVAPTNVSDCGIVYDSVSYRAQSCEQVKNGEYAKYKFSGMLAKKISILTLDEKQPNARTFLMPAGAGCVVITKEAI